MKRIGVGVAALLIAATWIGCNQPTTPSGSTRAAEKSNGHVQVKLSVPNMT